MKKENAMSNNFMRVLMTVIVCVAVGFFSACEPDTGDGCDSTEYDTIENGIYTPAGSLYSGPSYDSGVFYPEEISSSSETFPVFVFGCGAGSDPSDYEDHLEHWASWGFIIICEVSTGDGTELTAAIDWIISENSRRLSTFYQKVNTVKIAAGGHSQGSISTFEMADDSRLSTTIHVAGGSFDGLGAYNLKNPAAYICGADDILATPNAETDYTRTSVPVFMTIMDGVDHIMATDEGSPAIVAWLLWHLKGETNRQADFLEEDGYFQTGMYDSKAKNW